jgi:DNA-binding transcriptional LysR family regulator
MNTPLDLVLLKSFVAVVEAGSFSHAAERIGRSQSAMSMQIQRLEEAVGKPLLIRTPRSVTTNPAGETLLNYARRLLRLSDEAWSSVARPQEVGSVSLGVPDDYAASLLPSVLARFAASHPLVTVDLVCEPSSLLCKSIDERTLDLAIVTRRPEQALEVLRRRSMWFGSETPCRLPCSNLNVRPVAMC